MKKITLIFAGLIVISCGKNKTQAVVDIGMDIRYKDTAGRDLLDTTKVYTFKQNAMKHFYLNDANVKLIAPSDFFVFQDDTLPYMLRFFPYLTNTEEGTHHLTDILELNPLISDTIRSEVSVSENKSMIITKKVWYNSVLVYEWNNKREFVIIN